MQIILEVLPEAEKEAEKLGLKEELEKQKKLFVSDPWHPSLHFEKLQPHHLHIWSIRITKQYRAKLVKVSRSTYQIFQVTDYHKRK
jgi:plasmid maintenance system killer protein